MSDTRTRKTKPKLSRKPHRLNEFHWWYEEPFGVVVVAEARRPDRTHLATEQVRISWRSLLAAAKRAGAIR